MLDNKGENSDEKAINFIIGKSPKIGLDISLLERKFINNIYIMALKKTFN